MNFKFKQVAFFVFGFMFLVACDVPLAKEMLFAGQPIAEGTESVEIVDGVGQDARFGSIRKIDIDRLGNVYVYDLGAKYGAFYKAYIYDAKGGPYPPYTFSNLRRITPDGTVSTLIGEGAERQFVGLSDFTLRGDTLYTASAGCLLKANITENPLIFKAFYGTCLSDEDVVQLQEKVAEQGYSIPIKENFWQVVFEPLQLKGDVYYKADGIYNKSFYFKLTTEETVVDISRMSRGADFVNIPPPTSSYEANENFVYYTAVGDPGPGPTMAPRLIREKIDKPFGGGTQSTWLYEFSGGPRGVLDVNARNSVYVRDKDIIKRIQSNGHVEDLVKYEWDSKAIFRSCAVSFLDEFIYCATNTAIYRIDLRANKEE